MKMPLKLPLPDWEQLLEQLTEQLEAIQKERSQGILQQTQQAISVCRASMNILEKQIVENGFEDQAQEIHFFRNVKPKVYSRLIYYHKLFNIEIAIPVENINDQQSYFLKERQQISNFFEDNKFFYQYFRSGETYLDEKLFLRNHQNTALSLRIYDINANPAFSTNYDYIFSRILANELLLNYLNNRLFSLNKATPTSSNANIPTAIKNLTWTDSKSALIELLYAFKAKGSFNNGKATLKEITDFIQQVFDVELNNPSRDFQEILRRKTGYTIYLDGLKESYLKYIDHIESKDRR